MAGGGGMIMFIMAMGLVGYVAGFTVGRLLKKLEEAGPEVEE